MDLPVRVELLTGSVKTATKPILAGLEAGEVHILIGTHPHRTRRQFKRLGLAIIIRLPIWRCAAQQALGQGQPAPHVLVMTATPIPRTLAMTAYGDLGVSIIDEMPPGRADQTVHRTDEARLSVFQFAEDEIKRGRQVYVVYPLIEESATLDPKDLMDGYESIQAVPAPRFPHRNRPWPNEARSEGHGDGACKRNEPNSNHRHRSGRQRPQCIGDGHRKCRALRAGSAASTAGPSRPRGEQSYCILMTGNELSKDGRRRLETMCRTNDGFELAGWIWNCAAPAI